MADVSRLPLPVTRIWDWQLRAACRDLDSAMFFHPANERGPAAAARDRAAKRVCAGCPVLASCRRHALSVREPYGVWGGLTVRERESILGRTRRPVPGVASPAGTGRRGRPDATRSTPLGLRDHHVDGAPEAMAVSDAGTALHAAEGVTHR